MNYFVWSSRSRWYQRIDIIIFYFGGSNSEHTPAFHFGIYLFKVSSKGLSLHELVFLKQTQKFALCFFSNACACEELSLPTFLPSLVPFFGTLSWKWSLTQNSSFLYLIIFLVIETCVLSELTIVLFVIPTFVILKQGTSLVETPHYDCCVCENINISLRRVQIVKTVEFKQYSIQALTDCFL